MKNFRALLSYDGAPFMGWQRTGCGKSIEEVVQHALETFLRHPIQLQAASRTDRGVHATGQIINFFSDTHLSPKEILHRANQILPPEIALHDVTIAPDTFHPTLDALKKRYHYDICYGSIQTPWSRFTSWHFHYPLDLDAMREATKHLIGTHDFSTFCNAQVLWDKSTMCHLESIEIIPLEKERIRIALCADRFLYRMARNLAGTLAFIGCGKIEREKVPELLSYKHRPKAGMTAPAHGLTLDTVYY